MVREAEGVSVSLGQKPKKNVKIARSESINKSDEDENGGEEEK